LYDDATCARLDIPVPDRGRLRLLVDAYGLDAADRAALVPTVEARIECLIATARTWGTEGRPGWVDVWRDTGGRQWQAGLAYVRSQRGAWAQALRCPPRRPACRQRGQPRWQREGNAKATPPCRPTACIT